MENRTDISVSVKKIKAGPGEQFRKLLKKIATLEKDSELQKKELNVLMSFYLHEISPLVEKRREKVDQWIQLLMPFYSSTQLKEKDRELFAEIISSQLKEYTFLSDGQMPEHLGEYFKLVEGKTFEEAKNEEIRKH